MLFYRLFIILPDVVNCIYWFRCGQGQAQFLQCFDNFCNLWEPPLNGTSLIIYNPFLKLLMYNFSQQYKTDYFSFLNSWKIIEEFLSGRFCEWLSGLGPKWIFPWLKEYLKAEFQFVLNTTCRESVYSLIFQLFLSKIFQARLYIMIERLNTWMKINFFHYQKI